MGYRVFNARPRLQKPHEKGLSSILPFKRFRFFRYSRYPAEPLNERKERLNEQLE
jgi:hypothetical protein